MRTTVVLDTPGDRDLWSRNYRSGHEGAHFMHASHADARRDRAGRGFTRSAGGNQQGSELQFRDELSQRVAHVLQLFSIIKRSVPARVDDKESDEEFLKIATRIFSMKEEFAVLQQLFPGCSHVSCTNDTELF